MNLTLQRVTMNNVTSPYGKHQVAQCVKPFCNPYVCIFVEFLKLMKDWEVRLCSICWNVRMFEIYSINQHYDNRSV